MACVNQPVPLVEAGVLGNPGGALRAFTKVASLNSERVETT